jgi:hypothetical protein
MLSLERRVVSDLTETADPDVRTAVADWVARALDDMPDALRLGVRCESLLFTLWASVARPADLHGLLRWLDQSRVGLLRSYARLFRSLVLFGELELAGSVPR